MKLTLSESAREWSYAVLLAGTAVFLIAGMILFATAVSVETYFVGAILVALAGVSYVGARDLKGQRASDT